MLIGSYLTFYVSSKLLNNEKDLFGISSECKEVEELNKWLLKNNRNVQLDAKYLNEYERNHLNNLEIPEGNLSDFKEVIGHERIKNTLIKIVKSDTKPNGIILYGPPGTGKTSLVKSLAKTMNTLLLNISSSSIESKLFGDSTKNIKGIFTFAKKIKPCIVFIDELDGIAGNRSLMDQSHTTTMKTELMSCIDGYNSKDNDILVIGATNMIQNIDPAISRRMRMHISINAPTAKDMTDYLSNFMSKDTDEFVKLIESFVSKGVTFSDIHQLITLCQIEHSKVDFTTLKETLEGFSFL